MRSGCQTLCDSQTLAGCNRPRTATELALCLVSLISSSRNMANSRRDSGHWIDGVCGIFALVCGIFALLRLLLRGVLRGNGVPGYGNNGKWKDFGDALAMPSASGDLRISPNIDPEGQYNVPPVDQLPAIQDPMQNIDAAAAAAAADLDMWLAVAEVASLPRQIGRDEANMMVRRTQVPSSVAESGVAPSSVVDDVAAEGAVPQHVPPQASVPETVAADAPAPEVVGILAGLQPQWIEHEDEAHAQAQVEVEVAIEPSPPGMLERISDSARYPQFATASMAVPAGGLESNLEERMPVYHPEAGNSSVDLQAETIMQDGAENLEVEEPHAYGM